MNLENAVLNVSLLWILTTPHEFAHAWAATRLGDDTPRLDGRVTLNPLAHVDWIGTLVLPAVTSLMGAGFIGWGRAVRTNPAQLRGGASGLAAVALAGPAANVVLAFLMAIVALLAAPVVPPLADYLANGVRLSLYLALFNMIPVPPLDGSKLLLLARLPHQVYEEVARFGFLLLIVAMSATGLGPWMSSASWRGTEEIFRWLRV